MSKKTHQPALSIEDQIENLKTLGLIISDEDQAKVLLNDISYFRLVKGYSHSFKPKNGNYNKDVSFDDIVELYLFDSNFRHLIFPLIEKVEVNLRCRVANYFSEKYGIFGYKDVNNFTYPDYHRELYYDIEDELIRNRKSPFVKNFIANYDVEDLPFYALTELFSFSSLSKFYKNMLNPDKKSIAASYKIGYTYLESWFESLSYVRNVCAHYGRLYYSHFSKTPILYKQYYEMGIGNNRLFASLICLKHLIPGDKHWNEFIDAIESLFIKYPKAEPDKIGFIDSWKDVLFINYLPSI